MQRRVPSVYVVFLGLHSMVIIDILGKQITFMAMFNSYVSHYPLVIHLLHSELENGLDILTRLSSFHHSG